MFVRKKPEELDRAPAAAMLTLPGHPVVVILDNVRSMHNVGSAFRTCDAFPVEALYLCGYTPVPPHRDIHKTALGATETVRWQHFPDAHSAALAARDAGYRIAAVEQAHGSVPLQAFSWDRQTPLALVFGNEVGGVSDAVLQLAEDCIEIPQWGAKHSLNISVSIGVVLWELVR